MRKQFAIVMFLILSIVSCNKSDEAGNRLLSLQNMTTDAYDILNNNYLNVQKGIITEKEAQQKSLREITFIKDKYYRDNDFAIIDNKGNLVFGTYGIKSENARLFASKTFFAEITGKMKNDSTGYLFINGENNGDIAINIKQFGKWDLLIVSIGKK